jgi:GT2 family glycosyltransferase
MQPEASERFSVIVASRDRPKSLLRTLRAIRQLDYPEFEVVVVGDSAAEAALNEAGWDWVTFIAFDEPNLSAARNVGVLAAAGEVLAFIDDDAVPEPLWLHHHSAALRETGAAASVGFVRGPDGIGFQSRFQTIDSTAETHDEKSFGDGPFLPDLPAELAVKLIGTNMAVRKKALLGVGGFDPAYRYFLEDSDLSLRLRNAGYRAVVTPLAEVHHALAASPRRTRWRAPRTLFDIGRSTAVFSRRHSDRKADEMFERARNRERRKAVRQMVRGTLEPGDVARLMQTFFAGWEKGMSCDLPGLSPLIDEPAAFRRVPTLKCGHQVLTSRLPGRRAALREAEQVSLRGEGRASVFSFSLTSWPHSVRYTEHGVWLHSGGQFRDVGATGGRFRWCRFASRADEEITRVANRRGLHDADRRQSDRSYGSGARYVCVCPEEGRSIS